MSEKFEFIDGLKYAYPVVKMCAWLGISTSGYYEWRNRPASATAERREELKVLIDKAFADSDGTYGHRRIAAQLARWGIQAGSELVRMLMRDLGLVPCQPRPYRPVTTIPDPTGAAAAADLVGRDVTAAAPGEKMVGDITYIDTWQGWSYLATVIDCFSKQVVGWALADHMRSELVTEAIRMAATNHTLPAGAIFHSDRGSQYMSAQFASQLRALGIRQSVGRSGICFDNSLAESFNAALKVERVHRTQYPTREHARADIAHYIEIRYNKKRLHSGLDYRTPWEAHVEYRNGQVAA